MTENDLYTILQKDDNLREAIRRREQKLPPMPASLKEKPFPNPSRRKGRTKSLRWLAAVACLLIIIGIGVALMPSKESPSSGEFAIRQDGVGTASIEPKDSSLFTLHSSLQKNDSSLFTHNSSLKPAVLTERDIPITRPENYRYTPEEIALLKKQADDAYVKWVQLELEIAKYNLEQMAQQ